MSIFNDFFLRRKYESQDDITTMAMPLLPALLDNNSRRSDVKKIKTCISDLGYLIFQARSEPSCTIAAGSGEQVIPLTMVSIPMLVTEGQGTYWVFFIRINGMYANWTKRGSGQPRFIATFEVPLTGMVICTFWWRRCVISDSWSLWQTSNSG